MTAKQTTAQLRDRLAAEQIAAAVDTSQAAIIEGLRNELARLTDDYIRIYEDAESVLAYIEDQGWETPSGLKETPLTAIDSLRITLVVGDELDDPADPRTPVDGSGM